MSGLPAPKIATFLATVAAGLIASAVLRATGFYAFTAAEAEGLNVLIQLLGSIYAVLLAFAVFVIWGQFTDVENCVMREASALDDVLRFSEYLNAEARSAIRRATAAYTHQVTKYEWQALGDGRLDKQAEKLFCDVAGAVVEAAPQTPREEAIHARLLDMIQKAGAWRDERVAKSLTRIPPTLAALVNTIAALLLLLVLAYPFRHWLTGAACFAMVSLVLFLANFVMMDTDNPLQGTWNVSPKPFSDLNT